MTSRTEKDVLLQFGITNFALHEFVPGYVYRNYNAERVIQWLDMRVFQAWQFIRSERKKPIYMNTYGLENRPDWYPSFDGRGLRIPDGFKTSQHYYGKAGDGDEIGTEAGDLFEWIMKPHVQKELIKIGITTIEDVKYTPTWIHLDTRNWGERISQLKIVKPK